MRLIIDPYFPQRTEGREQRAVQGRAVDQSPREVCGWVRLGEVTGGWGRLGETRGG
jgi:hypothetical protein